MAIIFDGPVTPDAATAFVREVPTPATHLLNQILPDRLVPDYEVDVTETTRVNRVAKFRAPDGSIARTPRDSVETRKVRMLHVSSMDGKGELERMNIERLRQKGGDLAAATEAIYDDLANQTRYVHNRMELARGDVLTDGKLTLNENGLVDVEADFGVPAGNFKTAATLWSDAENSDPIAEMAAWVEYYTDVNGFPPAEMWLSRKIVGLLQKNKAIRTLSASLTGTPGVVGRTAIAQALAEYELPPIGGVYDTRLDVDGDVTRVVPEDKVLFLPERGTLGFTAWGITQTAQELVQSNQAELAFADAPGLAGIVVKSGPPFVEETYVDAIGIPVIEQPKALMVADVA